MNDSAHPPTRSSYSFDRDWPRERERLETQASFLDPGTIRLLQVLGLRPGWVCAEVGAGAGSVALRMAEMVGPGGRVVATDVDTGLLEPVRAPNLEIRRQDIVAEPLEEGAFDLVHTRLVLMHLPQRERALHNMVAGLKPGGWLLAEEYDLVTAGVFHPPSDLQERVNQAVQRLFEQRGGDARFGIKLVEALQSAGLSDVEAEGRLPVVRLGTPRAEALALKLEQFRAGLVQAGLVTEEEMQRAILELRSRRDGAVHYQSLMIAAWGRRPLTA